MEFGRECDALCSLYGMAIVAVAILNPGCDEAPLPLKWSSEFSRGAVCHDILKFSVRVAEHRRVKEPPGARNSASDAGSPPLTIRIPASQLSSVDMLQFCPHPTSAASAVVSDRQTVDHSEKKSECRDR